VLGWRDEGGDNFDGADDAGTELDNVFGRYPLLQDAVAADLVDLVSFREKPWRFEPRDMAAAGVQDVPVADDLGGVLRVEDWGRRWAAWGARVEGPPDEVSPRQR
jgi:hypothetical protein